MAEKKESTIFQYTDKNNLSDVEEIREEKKAQKKLIETMYMFQQYSDMFEKGEKYVIRGSVLDCLYGTKYAKFDCKEDYGIVKEQYSDTAEKEKYPVMTTKDYLEENIHNFGSCFCPEKLYKGKLPMTAESDGKETATRAPGNKFAHICVPLVGKGDGWKQVDGKVMVEINPQEYAAMLKDGAVLVCQYGGIISIIEVPDVKQAEKEIYNYMEFTGRSFLEQVEKKVLYIYSSVDYNENSGEEVPKWEGGFENGKDLTFGIGHSIQTKEEFERIQNLINGCKTEEELEKLANDEFEADMQQFVDKVNLFIRSDITSKEECIFLTQNQFDAVVIFEYNTGENLESNTLGKELKRWKGAENPEFDQGEIKKGFRTISVDHVDKPGLVVRRNNEMRIFYEGIYQYYDNDDNVEFENDNRYIHLDEMNQ